MKRLALRMAVIGLPLLVLVGAAPKPAPVSPHEKAALPPFDPSEFDEDVVWADGFFVRWPQRK